VEQNENIDSRRRKGYVRCPCGGAETFFGKNKGRTVDAMLKKFTAVVAILFIVSDVVKFFPDSIELKVAVDTSIFSQNNSWLRFKFCLSSFTLFPNISLTSTMIK